MNKDTPVAFRYPDITKEEHTALRCLSEGRADAHQQVLALAVIINKFSVANDLPYVPGSFDQTAFVNGRAYVGKRILKYTKALPVGQQEESPNA